MKKRIIASLVVLALLLLGTFLYFKGKRYEVVITQEQIDTTLAKTFPATKKYLFIFSITYSNPQVTLLEEDDRIKVNMDATLNIRLNDESKNLGGGCTITSGIRYDSEAQEFFLDDAQFDRLEIQGIPDAYLDQITKFASESAKEFVESKPIYRLEAKDGNTTAAKMLLKGFEVKNQSVHVSLGI
ncbi:MAG: DUF1439 domain-containing protein [Nitrosomonadaceae bacterium]